MAASATRWAIAPKLQHSNLRAGRAKGENMKSYERGSFPAIEEGKTYSVEYPFCRDKIHLFDEEGGAEVDTWRPGTRQMHENNGEFAERWTEADAMGEMLLSVVSVHRPGVYPERVFFTREWKDPDGKVFGKNNLRVKSKAAFKRMLKGYRHDFMLPPSP